MTATVKKKLCWNCEGRVSYEDEHCPYCGVYVHGTLHAGNDVPIEEDAEEEGEEELLKSEDDQPHKPLYTPEGIKLPESAGVAAKEKSKSSIKIPSLSLSKANKDLLPLTLLLAGGIFLLFSMALLLFSDKGVFTLQWDASWWYAYLLIAIPALFFGWRSLTNPPESAKE